MHIACSKIFFGNFNVKDYGVRNATAVFIINLSVSDLMFCCFNLPLAASTFWQRAWTHGHLLCQLFPLLRYGLLAVSLFTVLGITINRYVMIGHPTLYPKLYSSKFLAFMVACTWLFGFGALVPTWLGVWGRFGLEPSIGSCSILPDDYGHSPKEFLFLVAFVIPCISIVVCYARIFYIVRKTAMKSRAMNMKNMNANKGQYDTMKPPGYGKKYMKATVSTDDSAIGTSCGPSHSTEKSSSIMENTTSFDISTDIALSSLTPNPHFLSPLARTNTNIARYHHSVLAEPSSSSGVENGYYEEDEDLTSRSATPMSAYHSHNATPQKKKKYRKERIPSAVNSTLSHVVSVFRRGGSVRNSPRRPSALTHITPGKMTQKDKKLLKMILVIFSSFVICYLPITISKTTKTLNDVHVLHIGGYLLIYLTTCINPIIYVVMSSEYRQAYINLLTCRSVEHGPSTNFIHKRHTSQRA
ncbi:hypothetical protein M8J76_015006 [Diaphorina citri]|nr:hypothetical protein M8J76_015006 [Diaphorina citri]KAI5731270.1 hypothetical protein M8J77_007224 [Diaphorina citri]